MNRLRASRLGVAWLFLAGLLSAALIPLAGCGGETGGITSGVGGALLNVRVQTFVATVSVGSGGGGLPGVVNAIGRDNAGNKFTGFDLILKGASYDSQDVTIPFTVPTGPIPEEQRLFKVKEGSEVLTRAAFKRGDQYFFVDIPEGQNSEEQVDLARYSIDEADFYPEAFRFYSQTTPILRKGEYDVVLAFKSNARSTSSGLEEYWRVYYKLGATIDPAQKEVALRPGLVDAALTFSNAVKVTVPISNISPDAEALLVTFREIPLGNETAASFERLHIVENGASVVNVEVPIINRLRSFVYDIRVVVGDRGKTNAIAWYPGPLKRDATGEVDDDEAFSIAVQESNLQIRSLMPVTRLTRLEFDDTLIPLVGGTRLKRVRAFGHKGGGVLEELFDLQPNKVTLITPQPDGLEFNYFRDYISSVNGEFSQLPRPSGVQMAKAKFKLNSTGDHEVTGVARFNFSNTALDGVVYVNALGFPPATPSVSVAVEEVESGRRFIGPTVTTALPVDRLGVNVVNRNKQFSGEATAYSEPDGQGVILARATSLPGALVNDGGTSRVIWSDLITSVSSVQIGGLSLPSLERDKSYDLSIQFKTSAGTSKPVPVQLVDLELKFDGLSAGQTPLPIGNREERVSLDAEKRLILGSVVDSQLPYFFRIVATYRRADGDLLKRSMTCRVKPNKGSGEGEVKIGGGKSK